MKLIKSNKKAYFDYEILKEHEAGIVLQGSEVKAIKEGNVNLKGSYLKFVENELFAVGMHIGKYKPAGNKQHEKDRERKLLLKKKELEKLLIKSQLKGNALIPLEVYLKKDLVKIKIALVRGKRKYEKKRIIKEREQTREVNRKLKNYR